MAFRCYNVLQGVKATLQGDPDIFPGGGYRMRFQIGDSVSEHGDLWDSITASTTFDGRPRYCLPYVETEGQAYNVPDATWTTKLAQFADRMVGAGITWFELGNEVDNMNPGSNVVIQADRDRWDLYINRLRISCPILRARGLGILCSSHNSPIKATNMWSYIEAQGAFKYFDAVATHPYAGGDRAPGASGADPGATSPLRAMEKLDYNRERLDFLGYPKMDIWVTEIGWNTEDTAPPTDDKTVTWAQQADKLHKADNTGIFDRMQATCATTRTRLISWFTSEDFQTFETVSNADPTPDPDTTVSVGRNLNTTSFTLQVASTNGFSATGALIVGPRNVVVKYTALGVGQFLGCQATADTTRPDGDPTPVAAGAHVYQSHCNWANWCGIRENPIIEAVPTQKDAWARMVAVGDGGGLSQSVPAVITGTVTSPGTNVATLTATVDPNSVDTEYRFQWGIDTAYGHNEAWTNVGAGTTPVGVTKGISGLAANTTYHFRVIAQSDAGLVFGADQTFITIGGGNGGGGGGNVNIADLAKPLTPNTTYHYRLQATNSEGTTFGQDEIFITSSPATEPTVDPPSVVPLRLTVELITADGRTYRWDSDAAEIENRPFDITFSTQAGDGFAEASWIVPRPVGLDYPDLALLERGKLIGADASVAYEGRVTGMPRSVDDAGQKIEVQLQGLMASARDRPFQQVYVDRTGDRWQPPSLQLREAILDADQALDADYTTTVDVGSIHFKGVTDKSIPDASQTVVVYQAPAGCKVDSFQCVGRQRNVSHEYTPFLYGTDDKATGTTAAIFSGWEEAKAHNTDNTRQVVRLDTPRSYVALRMRHGTPSFNAPVPASRRYNEIAIYGDHGVTHRDNGTHPAGVYASDVIADIIDAYCPLLDASEVTPTDTLIGHLVFDTPTLPFDAFTLLNAYHQYLLGAWEDGKVQFEPADLTGADWIVRTDELGVTIDLQGDTTDQFANGCVVSYVDVAERSKTLFPSDFESLRDDDPDNPANKEGIELWTTLELSVPADQAGALAIGKAALSEFNRPKAPGTISVATGYIQDFNENLQPGWKVRAGDTVRVIDLPNDDPRLITATSWSEEGVLQMTLEQPSTRVDAVLARLELGASTPR